MQPTLVLLAVGLTPRHLGPLTPNLARLAAAGGMRRLETITPAVTCSVQATFMTASCRASTASWATAGSSAT